MMKPKAADRIIHMGTKSAGFSVMRLSPIGLGLFVDNAVDGRTRDPVRLRDLAQAVAALAIAEDGLAIEIQRPAADVASFEAGAPHAGAHPLDDQVAFEFRDGPDDDHDGAAQRAAGVDLLAEAERTRC